MVKDNQRTETSSHVLLPNSVKVFQRVTGNEGPSPLMKRYLESRQKGELVGLIKRESGKKH